MGWGGKTKGVRKAVYLDPNNALPMWETCHPLAYMRGNDHGHAFGGWAVAHISRDRGWATQGWAMTLPACGRAKVWGQILWEICGSAVSAGLLGVVAVRAKNDHRTRRHSWKHARLGQTVVLKNWVCGQVRLFIYKGQD